MNYKELIPENLKKEIAGHIIELLEDGYGEDQYGADLHNTLFDDYIIGTYRAKKWLNKHFESVFDAIGLVINHEKDNTDVTNPEKVCNIVAYIVGEEILNASETLRNNWNNRLNENNCAQIIKEIKKEFLND